jgi:hypothetical protein
VHGREAANLMFLHHKFRDGKQVVTLEGDFSRLFALFWGVELVHTFVPDLLSYTLFTGKT